ncbi:hypothetical protein ACF07V_06745 [Streptomyces sp. NPDC015661]|uniref:hypothetical protein n=1 Tax=Streptomyces sp. NPDC015661 TaxID=3364961 RepID=UPI0036FAE2D2
MLDDRNATPARYEITDIGIWDRAANLQGWQALLGDRFGTDRVSSYAAPPAPTTSADCRPRISTSATSTSSATKTSSTPTG